MGNILSTHKWGNEWDGLAANCVKIDQDAGFLRSEIHLRLNKLSDDPANGGYVLQGRPGSGKREIILQTLKMSRNIADPTWISGSEYAQELRYGAIQYLLVELSDEQLDSPMAVYGHLHQIFGVAAQRPFVVMENISLVDSLTTMVMAQLVTNGVIKLLVMDDRSGELPNELQVLLRNGVLSFFHLGPLGLEESKRRIEAGLGHRISYLTASRLWEFSAGNAESLDAVVADCKAADQFIFEEKNAALTSEALAIGAHLELRVVALLERLDLDQQRIYKGVALADPGMEIRDSEDYPVFDYLHARRLIRHTSAGWKITEPCMQQAICKFWSGTSGTRQNMGLVQDFAKETGAISSPIDFRRVPQAHQHPSDMRAAPNPVQLNEESSQRLGERLQQLRILSEKSESPHKTELIDLTLTLLNYYLGQGPISQALPLVEELLGPESKLWILLSPCQKHLVLAQASEFYARVNELQKSEHLMDALMAELPQSSAQSSEYSLDDCMGLTLRSMINSAVALARWNECQSLIKMVLKGSIGNPEIIAHAEAVRALALSITGNFGEAMESLSPLHLQLQFGGSESAIRWMGTLSKLTIPIMAPPHGASDLVVDHWSVRDEEPVNVQQCVRQLFEILAIRQPHNFTAFEQEMDRLARWALARGEKLLASHLWALCIRDGRFEYAAQLETLQKVTQHPLAQGFLKLAEAAKQPTNTHIFAALQSMVALGYVSYANERFNALFTELSAHQNRVLVRNAKQGLGYRHQDISEVLGYGDLEKLTGLTRRESFVATAAAKGLSNAEIAEAAKVSVRTVEGHLYQVYSKLGIGRRGELQVLVANQRRNHSNAAQ